jgi:hypothetical protein
VAASAPTDPALSAIAGGGASPAGATGSGPPEGCTGSANWRWTGGGVTTETVPRTSTDAVVPHSNPETKPLPMLAFFTSRHAGLPRPATSLSPRSA